MPVQVISEPFLAAVIALHRLLFTMHLTLSPAAFFASGLEEADEGESCLSDSSADEPVAAVTFLAVLGYLS